MRSIMVIPINEDVEQGLKIEFPRKTNQPFQGTTLGKLLIVGFISSSDDQFNEILSFIMKQDYVRRTIYMDGELDVIMNKLKFF